MTAAEDVSDLLAAMRREFSGWTIVEVGGRWFAARGPINGAQLPAGALEADSPAALYLLLEEKRR
ncbi:hypothetical protein [Actinomadura opuntiae]|uniref:hypothetical protein n=1 Tax=Actinomadura sp. OS1-43 TaxID=604315 RepID=UPI00255AF630|nr:hypothetical protein [Actinomadura sp. OS1-43]MDL4814968.1 hypothetical protein [Actinomadura sp. OS1-43]